MSAAPVDAAALDTSIVVRYLVADAPELAEQAASIVDSGQPLILPAVALAEAAYVLMSVYRIARADVIDALIDLARRPTIRIDDLDRSLVAQALLLCRSSGRVSVADALIWATARSRRVGVIYSLDQRFPNDGVAIRSMPPRRET